MSRRKKGIPVYDPEESDRELLCPSASAEIMTGDIPTEGTDNDERNSYQEVFQFLTEKQAERDS